jgi:hypothetical protein
LKINAGVPYVSFMDLANGKRASVMTGLPAHTNNFRMFSDAATPYILYGEDPADGLRQVSRFNGTDWTKVTSKLGMGADFEAYPSFAISKDVPWVLYRYAVSKYVAYP